MIKKWIKSLIEKVFGKFCKCEEPIILEDEEKYLAEEKALADHPRMPKLIPEAERINQVVEFFGVPPGVQHGMKCAAIESQD